MLASPTHGNLAVALLSRSGDDDSLASSLRSSSGSQHLKAFKTDTSAVQLKAAFDRIKSWNAELGNLKLKIAIW
jgi:hypothetical protein